MEISRLMKESCKHCVWEGTTRTFYYNGNFYTTKHLWRDIDGYGTYLLDINDRRIVVNGSEDMNRPQLVEILNKEFETKRAIEWGKYEMWEEKHYIYKMQRFTIIKDSVSKRYKVRNHFGKTLVEYDKERMGEPMFDNEEEAIREIEKTLEDVEVDFWGERYVEI